MLPPDPAWPEPTQWPSLAGDEVHVWRVALDQAPPHADELLAPDERDRAARYRIPSARRQFIVSRAALRSVLAAYLGIEPRELSFTHGPQGKPRLAGERPPLHFNVSHSHGLALVAVTRDGEIGVDVERVRSFANQFALAERFFAPPEVQTLRRLPPEQMPEAFFRCWTRKEAFVKAHGTGIGFGVERVEVTLLPGEPARLVRLDGCDRSAAAWALAHLAPSAGYVGALALCRTNCRTAGWTWPPDLAKRPWADS